MALRTTGEIVGLSCRIGVTNFATTTSLFPEGHRVTDAAALPDDTKFCGQHLSALTDLQPADANGAIGKDFETQPTARELRRKQHGVRTHARTDSLAA